ncbi:RDD family protein [Fulvivirga sp. RKSG066]|uniref:RDD family protein n=1 Tax=Fulvivirga aurantia TaxID=2529383 RepID=UPI0012BC9F73|nr:RDD family protein [Fulvivirga aurantia]MTI22339.1 RDD family protein [Fulvivirga aurantia]
METATTTATPVAQKYGGFWIRFVAYIIDAIILGIVASVVIVPIFGALGFGAYSSMQGGGEITEDQLGALIGMISGAGLFLQVVNIVAGWLYFALMESSGKQGTIGKIALGLKVVDKNGERLNFGTATIRYFGKLVSTAILMIGFIIAGFTEKKQALHDMIASTYVIKN